MTTRPSPDSAEAFEVASAPVRPSLTRAMQWLADNREAVGAYNAEIREHGVWSDGLRRW